MGVRHPVSSVAGRLRLSVCLLSAAAGLVLALPSAALADEPIVYTYERGDWSDVFTVSEDGSSTTELTLEGLSRSPSWSADGGRIAYTKGTRHPDMINPRQIWTMRADASSKVFLRTWGRDITAIDWGPDDRYLAIADRGGSPSQYRIMRYDMRTGALRTILRRTAPGAITDLDWAADGGSIAFVHDYENTFECASVNLNGGGVSPAPDPYAASVARGDLTGRWAFRRRSSASISRLRVTGPGGVTSILSIPQIGGVSWRPDEGMIAFDGRTCECEGGGIYTIVPDGSGLTRIVEDWRAQYPKFVARNPEWRPDRTREAPTIKATVPEDCSYRGPAEMTFQLKAEDGSPVAGKTLVVQVSFDRLVWETMTTGTTGADGIVTAIGSPSRATWYRAYFAGDATYGQCFSAIYEVKPRPNLSTPSTPSSVRAGAFFTVTGYVEPRHPAGSIPVHLTAWRWERLSSGDYGWVARRIAGARVSDYRTYSRYRPEISLPFKGSYRIQAYHREDSLHAASRSGFRYFTVY